MSFEPYWPAMAIPHASIADTSASPIPLDEPTRQLDGLVAIGQHPWGPFQRLHIEGRIGQYSYTISTGRFEAIPLPDGDTHISTSLHVAVADGFATATIAMTRSPDGRLMGTEVGEFTGGALDDATHEAVRSGLGQSTGGFLSRRTLHEGAVFYLGECAQRTEATGNDPRLSCRVVGRSFYKRRPVAVARCRASHALALAQWHGWLHVDGQVAVDIDTGVVVLSMLDGWVMDAQAAMPLASLTLKAWFSVQAD